MTRHPASNHLHSMIVTSWTPQLKRQQPSNNQKIVRSRLQSSSYRFLLRSTRHICRGKAFWSRQEHRKTRSTDPWCRCKKEGCKSPQVTSEKKHSSATTKIRRTRKTRRPKVRAILTIHQSTKMQRENVDYKDSRKLKSWSLSYSRSHALGSWSLFETSLRSSN